MKHTVTHADEFWQALGFDRLHTGGGCYAYALISPDWALYITRRDDLDVPSRLTEPVTIGLYDPDCNEDIAVVTFPDSPTAGVALAGFGFIPDRVVDSESGVVSIGAVKCHACGSADPHAECPDPS